MSAPLLLIYLRKQLIKEIPLLEKNTEGVFLHLYNILIYNQLLLMLIMGSGSFNAAAYQTYFDLYPAGLVRNPKLEIPMAYNPDSLNPETSKSRVVTIPNCYNLELSKSRNIIILKFYNSENEKS